MLKILRILAYQRQFAVFRQLPIVESYDAGSSSHIALSLGLGHIYRYAYCLWELKPKKDRVRYYLDSSVKDMSVNVIFGNSWNSRRES